MPRRAGDDSRPTCLPVCLYRSDPGHGSIEGELAVGKPRENSPVPGAKCTSLVAARITVHMQIHHIHASIGPDRFAEEEAGRDVGHWQGVSDEDHLVGLRQRLIRQGPDEPENGLLDESRLYEDGRDYEGLAF